MKCWVACRGCLLGGVYFVGLICSSGIRCWISIWVIVGIFLGNSIPMRGCRSSILLWCLRRSLCRLSSVVLGWGRSCGCLGRRRRWFVLLLCRVLSSHLFFCRGLLLLWFWMWAGDLLDTAHSRFLVFLWLGLGRRVVGFLVVGVWVCRSRWTQRLCRVRVRFWWRSRSVWLPVLFV